MASLSNRDTNVTISEIALRPGNNLIDQSRYHVEADFGSSGTAYRSVSAAYSCWQHFYLPR